MAKAPVDIPVQVSGLSDLQKLERQVEALQKEVLRLNNVTPKAANDVKKLGASARGATGGVKALGLSIKTALGPITAALTAVGGLAAAFNTLKTQDFSEAKFESLGGNSEDLVRNLKEVSKELRGQRSVTELTAASYDVASAGFNSAAEAAEVLKAASQGATGGFSDLNTVANATTSVLNAYQLSAAEATTVVDQFIQTQNDGKIVVAEYARNIGKVASAAAGLGIPLAEVNAVIAQSTAAGVQAEVAFTGLKGALARLASGEASKALEDLGINIDAASLEANGLLGELKKLEGLDTGTLFKALGTEAGPALLPVIQNLEKYEQLLENQKNANGVAAQAAATASGTIEGAWKRVTVAFENLFADQSELGQIIRGTLLAAAATVELFAAAVKLLLVPIRAVLNLIGKVASAVTGIKDSEQALASFTDGWFDFLKIVERVADFFLFFWDRAGDAVIDASGIIVNEFQYWSGEAFKIVGGVTQYILDVIGQVTSFFSKAANNVGEMFAKLWQGINEGTGNTASNIIKFFGDAFNKVLQLAKSFYNMLPEWLKGAISGGISFVKKIGGAIKNEVEYMWKASAGMAGSLFGGGGQLSIPDGVAAPNAVGGSGGGGGGGSAKTSDATKELERQQKIQNDIVDSVLKQTAEFYKQVQALDDQKALLEGKLNGNEREVQLAIDIRKATEGLPAPQAAYVEQRLRGIDALEREIELQAELNNELTEGEQMLSDAYNIIANNLTSSIQGLIDGTKEWGDVLSDILGQLGSMFLNAGFKGLGGALNIPGFANGGRPPMNQVSIVGERGPELFVPDSAGTIISNEALQRYSPGNSSSSVGGQTRTIRFQSTVINSVEYVTVEQAMAMSQQAADDGAKRGAAAGHARSMDTLKNSRSQRQKLGM